MAYIRNTNDNSKELVSNDYLASANVSRVDITVESNCVVVVADLGNGLVYERETMWGGWLVVRDVCATVKDTTVVYVNGRRQPTGRQEHLHSNPHQAVMRDGEEYWLGATFGRYDAVHNVFNLGNCWVDRWDTAYAFSPVEVK